MSTQNFTEIVRGEALRQGS